ncbi:UDP-glycosyltransferase 71B1 [Raphanus sativus]|uniref:Glycosyltransferase n=1 Tax=Raphanus sativus TaxID=3726 RepID=A0A6J0M1W2_RAPSA|nr:UDP-glycosyltransferase 71B1 [Raphanus sativus]KAJ4894243.1 UDP-glycosyltransferase 71B1 [Raphanus sativus]
MELELVFIPSPGIGHFRSTTAVAKLIVDSDERISVTLIVIPPRFSNHASSSYPESQNRLSYCLLPPGDQSSTGHTFISYINSYKPQVRTAVSELSRRRQVAGIVVDMFCTSMTDIANEFGLPTYTFYTSNASYLGLQFHVQSLYDEKKLDLSELNNSEAEFEFDVPTLTRPFPAKCLPSFMLSKDWFPYIMSRARTFRESKGILVNSVAEMEPQALKFFSDSNSTPPVYAVGPILDLKTDGNDTKDEKRTEILSWLDKQPPRSVVFLCFGSMGGFSEDQTRETAVALERSGHRFLWSVRRASPVDKTKASPPEDFTNLEEILPEGFLERTAEIGKIISWAPQIDVLKSDAVGGFVTHCGWNSTLESLWFGVPTAAWPIYAEQQFNAFHMVEELGLAAEIRKDYRGDNMLGKSEMVTAKEIESGINCVMDQGSEMRKKVKKMSDKLHVAWMDGGSSNTNLKKFVQDVVENVP